MRALHIISGGPEEKLRVKGPHKVGSGKMRNPKLLAKDRPRNRAQRGRPRPMSLAGFLFWFAALSAMSSFNLLLAFEFREDGIWPYGAMYGITVLLLLLLTVCNILQAPARNGCMLIGVIVLSILANGWLIDLSVWRYPISSSQPYIVKMTPDDVVLLLLCIGQILAETAAGTIALFAVTARRCAKNKDQSGETSQGNGQ